MRIVISSFFAILVSISIFFAMEIMTSSSDLKKMEKKDNLQLVYLRDKKDTNINEKKRVEPKKEEHQNIKKIEFQQVKMKINIEKNVKIEPILSHNIKLPSLSSLNANQINVNAGIIDANTLMTLNKVHAKYPRRAKLQNKEGFVQLQFKIDSNGYVKYPQVIKSSPIGLFEDSAINAIKRWRFKPISNTDSNSLIDATITFNYKLAK